MNTIIVENDGLDIQCNEIDMKIPYKKLIEMNIGYLV